MVITVKESSIFASHGFSVHSAPDPRITGADWTENPWLARMLDVIRGAEWTENPWLAKIGIERLSEIWGSKNGKKNNISRQISHE